MVDDALNPGELGDLIATLGSIDDDEIDWQNVARTTVLIHQTFRYEYPSPIASLRQRLIVVPPDYHDDQRLLTHKLRVSGCDVDTERSYDTFGNVVLDLTLQRVEREVEFTSWIVVEREAGADGSLHTEPLPPDARFSEPSRLTRPDEALTAVAAELEGDGRDRARAGRPRQPARPRSPPLRVGGHVGRDHGRPGVGRRRRRLPGLRPLHARRWRGSAASRPATSRGTCSARAAPTPGSRSSSRTRVSPSASPPSRSTPPTPAAPGSATSPSPWAATTATSPRPPAPTRDRPRAC